MALLSPEKQKSHKAGFEPGSAAVGLLTTSQRKEVSQHSCSDHCCQGSSLWVSPWGSLPCRNWKGEDSQEQGSGQGGLIRFLRPLPSHAPAPNSFRAISAPVTDPPTDGLGWLFLPSDSPILGVRGKEEGIGRAQACWRTQFSQAQVKASGHSSLPLFPRQSLLAHFTLFFLSPPS